LPTGEYGIDPDEQVQSVVRLVFDQFERLGTARRVAGYFRTNGIRIGIRPMPVPTEANWSGACRHTARSGAS
jgi:hypothetical protein